MSDLLELGYNANQTDKIGKTAMYQAITTKKYRSALKLLKMGKELPQESVKAGYAFLLVDFVEFVKGIGEVLKGIGEV